MKYPRYPSYKSSGVEWLGEVPAHWDVERLKYSATINDEALPETTDPGFGISYVDIGSVDPVKGIVTVEKMVFEDAPSRARRVVADGDTIISTVRTYLKAIAPIQNPAPNTIVSTGFAVVRPRKVRPDYMSYAAREPGFVEAIVARSVGVSYPAINASQIGTLPIPLPPEDEQQTIADFLDAQTTRIDTLIEKKRRLIEKLEGKRAALISRTVTRGLPPEAAVAAGLDPNPRLKPSGIDWLGDVPEHWSIKRLKHVKAKTKNAFVDGPFGSNLKSEHFVSDGDVFVIESGFATRGRINEAALKQIELDHFLTIRRSETKGGDIIIAKIGAYFGLNNILPELTRPAVVSGNSLKLTVDQSEILTKFAHYLLLHLKWAKAMDLLVNVTAQPALSLGGMNTLGIVVPPLDEQHAIVEYIASESKVLETSLSTIETAIDRLKELRSSLIESAITGKIDVRGFAV